ncbi:hypothetical protein ACIBCH_09785 [Amycolatopsis thailandensis]|uniref:hypothetical protein n=1 Tax=Amycolatopsis thailandensis TaxID=589330 RepID=UPI00378D6B16
MPIKEAGVLLRVRDIQGDVWTYNPADGLWYTQETRPFAWVHLTRKWAPLTEVLPGSDGKITPPWDAAIVAALNAFQERGEFHPFTCPREHFTDGEVKLRATRKGWVCTAAPACGYTQDWAHAFMADVPPAQSSQGAPKPSSPVSVVGGGSDAGVNDELRACFLAELVDIIHDNPTAFLRVDAEATADQVVEHFTQAGWRPPPTDEKAEWGCRWPGTGVVQQLGSRDEAEAYRIPGTELVCRRVSPWEQVEQS